MADTDHAWDLLTSVTGGIIGALAGGVPAYALAVKATREATAKDEANQLQLDLGTLQSAFVKLLEIVNGTYTICSQINEMLYNAHANGHKDWQLWQKVLPLLGADVGPSVRFDSREIALFMRKLESNDFANALTLLDKRYEALKAVVKSYSDRRERLMAMLPASELIDGVGTTKLKKKKQAALFRLPTL
ncbi:hypothetical protein [Sphingomonas sp. Mn802worker]|uniref:hypothetical protein n=1 Tax=Sphingomonas sp. Mn802worker TaxID=629773 RepID=UPI0012EAEA40|nr:hypothetical protein [Sphingomonas sp. Mn802worker]